MRIAKYVFWLALGLCALTVACKHSSMTYEQCLAYLSAAEFAVAECDRIKDEDDANTCRGVAYGALLIARAECSRLVAPAPPTWCVDDSVDPPVTVPCAG